MLVRILTIRKIFLKSDPGRRSWVWIKYFPVGLNSCSSVIFSSSSECQQGLSAGARDVFPEGWQTAIKPKVNSTLKFLHKLLLPKEKRWMKNKIRKQYEISNPTVQLQEVKRKTPKISQGARHYICEGWGFSWGFLNETLKTKSFRCR